MSTDTSPTPAATPAAPAPAVPAASAPVFPIVLAKPAWWVPWDRWATFAARLVYPLAVLASLTWLIGQTMAAGVSAWYVIAVLLAVVIALFNKPRDPDACA